MVASSLTIFIILDPLFAFEDVKSLAYYIFDTWLEKTELSRQTEPFLLNTMYIGDPLQTTQKLQPS